jgi:multisubunit Na+/H+ antiporter MnhB subunit
MSEDETASGKNSKAPKLIDAAIWIFVVTGFSIVTSIVYVFGLSRGLNFEFRIFFGIKDYLEVTPYWLGPPLSIVFVLMIFFYPLTHLKDKDVFPSKREPGQKWLPWLRYKLRARHWFLAASIALLVAAMVLTLFSRFLFSPPLALAELKVIAVTSGVYYATFFSVLNPKFREVIGGSLVPKISNQPFLRLGVTLALTVVVYACLLGIIWEPVDLWSKPISTIHVADSNSEVRGRVLFSLTQYLLAMREDGTVVAIPVAKVDRIETSRNQTIGSKPSPTPVQTTPTPLSISTPTPNAILTSPAPRLSPVPTPTLAPSPKRGRSPG